MTSASKIKGSGYERQVAKFLTDHYGFQFIRNISGSGAYIGGKNSIRKLQLTEDQIRHSKGDIVPPNEFRKFNAEVKFYGDFSFHQLCTTASLLESWLQQLLTVADADDVNVLFFKINRKGQYVVVQDSFLWEKDCSHVIYRSVNHGDWIVFSFEKFFELNTDKLKQFCSN